MLLSGRRRHRGTGGARDGRPGATAIDILLNPDADAGLGGGGRCPGCRKVYPGGFALDASHLPHITLVQSYVRTADLTKVYAAVDKVLKRNNPAALTMTATGYYFIPNGETGLGGIVVKPTPELLSLQAALLAAIKPYVSTNASAAAFHTTPAEPDINQPTTKHFRRIDYVIPLSTRQGAGATYKVDSRS